MSTSFVRKFFSFLNKNFQEFFFKAAKRCGNLIWKKGILAKGPGICHGIAGSGYGLLLLYRFTKEEEWLNKAKTFGFIMLSLSFKVRDFFVKEIFLNKGGGTFSFSVRKHFLDLSE